jgi:ribosome-binding factor A
VSEVIRREVAGIVDGAFAAMGKMDEAAAGPVFVSVVDVRCSDDLKNARVGVSVLGTEEQRRLALGWLKENRRALRWELAQGVKGMKSVPELNFAESEVAQAVKTVGIIDRLARERAARAGGGGGAAAGAAADGPEMDAMAEGAFLEEEGEYDPACARTAEEEALYDEDDDFDDSFIVEVDADEGGGEDDADADADAVVRDYGAMADDEVLGLLFKTDAHKRSP